MTTLQIIGLIVAACLAGLFLGWLSYVVETRWKAGRQRKLKQGGVLRIAQLIREVQEKR